MTVVAPRQTRPKIGLSAALGSGLPRAAGALASALGGRVQWVALSEGGSDSDPEVLGLAGLVTRLGKAERPDGTVPVTDPDAMEDPTEREHFAEQVFAYARLRELLASDWGSRDLVEFHTNHKMQLFAHDPNGTRELGRLVANVRGQPNRAELAATYRRLFAGVMATPTTVGRWTDALQHAAGYFPDGDPAKAELRSLIDAYRRGEQSVTVPLTRLTALAYGFSIGYLMRQTLLDPVPDELDL